MEEGPAKPQSSGREHNSHNSAPVISLSFGDIIGLRRIQAVSAFLPPSPLKGTINGVACI
jgi:hypothetical protein